MIYEPSDHTFVVCAYGESPYLRYCLDSVCNQNICSHVIVSTSTPNSYIAELCDEFSVECFENAGAPGIGKDWNRALSHVETPLATIAHQDDVYLPEYAESLLDCFNRSKVPLIYFCAYGEIRGNEIIDYSPLLNIKRFMLSPLKNPKHWKSVGLRRLILSFGSPISCPSVSYNLERMHLPLFNEEMKCSLDWDAWERISMLRGDFVYDSTVRMRHRIHPGSETSHLIEDSTRTNEDYEMMCRFWPRALAGCMNRLYSLSQKSNSISK
ncbi:glycosyltransferase involved in cell wall biosynthesis [Slackia isoflavoniconvertens]|nr:glycosyltransferase family A protein [Slackia isoflavoniconvertens]MBB3280007.1 glycosyltransferase involved in cell wall biosynthesis [Slackia isoflavoniconvertens]